MHKKPRFQPRIWKTKEVFVAGDVPTITYNPRDDLHLEQEVRDYRDQPGKALSVSGPSKSGKTVLIERLFPRTSAIWVQGSDLSSVDRLWQRLADGLNAFDQIGIRGEQTEGRSAEGGFTASRRSRPRDTRSISVAHRHRRLSVRAHAGPPSRRTSYQDADSKH
jgi:hypothetical protein